MPCQLLQATRTMVASQGCVAFHCSKQDLLAFALDRTSFTAYSVARAHDELRATLQAIPKRLLHHLGLGFWSFLAEPTAGLLQVSTDRPLTHSMSRTNQPPVVHSAHGLSACM